MERPTGWRAALLLVLLALLAPAASGGRGLRAQGLSDGLLQDRECCIRDRVLGMRGSLGVAARWAHPAHLRCAPQATHC